MYREEPAPEDSLFYGDALPVLVEATGRFLAALEAMRRQTIHETERDLIHYHTHRIKSARSMREKLQRNRFEPDLTHALTALYDAAGVRIVCPFIDDIDEVVERIRGFADHAVVMEKDYVRAPKDNGYRSYHMILRTPCIVPSVRVAVCIEVQVRTIAMESWASIEHELKYKQHVREEPLIARELKRCANEIAATDLALQTLHDLIHAR